MRYKFLRFSIIQIATHLSNCMWLHCFAFLISLPKYATGIFLGNFLYPLFWQNTIRVFGLSIFILSINFSFWTKTCLLMETHCLITLYFNDYKICLIEQPFKSLLYMMMIRRLFRVLNGFNTLGQDCIEVKNIFSNVGFCKI